MPYTPVKSSRKRVSLMRLKRAKKRLFRSAPSMMVGEGYNPSLVTVVGKRKKNKTFSDKLSNNQYPAFSILHADRGSVNTVGLNPKDYGSSTVTTGKMGFDGLQHVYHQHVQSTNNMREATMKARDVYTSTLVNSLPDGMMDEVPSADAGGSINAWWQKTGIKMKQLKFSYSDTIVNTGNTSAEFEVLMVTPRRLTDINNTNSYQENPWQCWISANQTAALVGNFEDPAIAADPLVTSVTYAVNPYTLGDRPYKGQAGRFWNKYFKVVDKKSFKLTPGSSQKYAFVKNMNRLVDWEDLDNYSRIPGIDYWIMIISKGQVVNGTVVTTGADVTTSDHAFAWVAKRSQTYQGRKFIRPIKFSNMATFSTVYDLTGLQQAFVNPDTNQIQTGFGGAN